MLACWSQLCERSLHNQEEFYRTGIPKNSKLSSEFLAFFDSGSEFSIFPAIYFEKLHIGLNKLDTSRRYNILSATEKTINAVQGSITLSFYVPMFKTILHGNNFLKENEANISYCSTFFNIQLKGNYVKTISETYEAQNSNPSCFHSIIQPRISDL